MPEKISSANAEHYRWGGPSGTDCDAWYLVRTPELHIIEERMPPGAQDELHHHTYARQFFYVLEGELTLKIDGTQSSLGAGEGLQIAPGEVHQAVNDGAVPVHFLVISRPPSHEDRVDA